MLADRRSADSIRQHAKKHWDMAQETEFEQKRKQSKNASLRVA